MTEAERAFYEWFHAMKLSGVLLEHYQQAFLADWTACTMQGVKADGL